MLFEGDRMYLYLFDVVIWVFSVVNVILEFFLCYLFYWGLNG